MDADQKAQSIAVTPVLRNYADTMQSISERSDNPILQDFATLSAIYLGAYRCGTTNIRSQR